ncbi:MAG: hypothetical protein AB1465_00535, partial [Patescibacteria group bacterium]
GAWDLGFNLLLVIGDWLFAFGVSLAKALSSSWEKINVVERRIEKNFVKGDFKKLEKYTQDLFGKIYPPL